MSAVKNRVKFALGGHVLETVNPYLPGHPHEELVSRVEQGKVGRVLELCAGTGYASRHVAQRNSDAELVALDLSPEMIAVGRRKLAAAGLTNMTLVEGSVEELPYQDGSFDTVMAVLGLHEVPTAVRHAAVREAARVLGPGGRFVIVDIDRPPLTGPLLDLYFLAMEPRHAREVCGTGLVDLLSDNGFVIDHHETATPWRPTQTVVAHLPRTPDDAEVSR